MNERQSFLSRWWMSPSGGYEVLRLALPMIISVGSLAVMQFIDRVFLTWYDPVTVGAAFSGGQFIWTLASFPFSIVAYSVAFVSQYNGAGEFRRIGEVVWQGVFIAVVFTPFFFLIYPWSDSIFTLFDHAPEIVALEKSYFFWSLWGIGPVIATQGFEAFFVGRKKTKVVMNVSLIALFLNIGLDYLVIFGVGGFPRLGIVGAALATSICQIIRLMILFGLTLYDDVRAGSLFAVRKGCRIVPSELFALLKYGSMGGMEYSLEMVSFTFFVFLLGKLGEVGSTSSAIAINLNAITFLPVVGIGTAVMTMVGNAIGKGRPHFARRCTFSAAALAAFFTGFFFLLFLLIPDVFLSVYALGNPDGFAPYYDVTRILLRFVAVYLFFDTINIVFCSALRGAGDVKFVMFTTISLAPFLAVFSWLGVGLFHFGIYWCWTILSVYISLMGLAFFCRFMRGTWMEMRLVDVAKRTPLRRSTI
ncbi:MAG: MATE family efflux transporter [Thermoguttaceae bacterium]|nr:MATE family efflux transporter [Thermoguttaceae bacterium]